MRNMSADVGGRRANISNYEEYGLLLRRVLVSLQAFFLKIGCHSTTAIGAGSDASRKTGGIPFANFLEANMCMTTTDDDDNSNGDDINVAKETS